MNTNDFEQNSKQLRKKYNFESSSELMDELKDIFIRSLGQPRDLALDLFDYIMDRQDLEDSHIIRLSDMVDLFQMNYDENFNKLNNDDWGYLKDLVNNWAQEMDMDIVRYLMQQVINAGAFD